MGAGNVHRTLKQIAHDLASAGIDYAILGAMALNAYGYRRETIDVDLLVTPEGLALFRETFEGRGYLASFTGARRSFRNTTTDTKVEFLTAGEFPGDGKPKPVAFPHPAKVSKEIDGVRFVELPVLINLKLASGMTNPGRLRDLADVQELARELGLSEDFAQQLDPYVRSKFIELVGSLRATDPHNESPQT